MGSEKQHCYIPAILDGFYFGVCYPLQLLCCLLKSSHLCDIFDKLNALNFWKAIIWPLFELNCSCGQQKLMNMAVKIICPELYKYTFSNELVVSEDFVMLKHTSKGNILNIAKKSLATGKIEPSNLFLL